MGITGSMARVMLEQSRSIDLSGSVMELGRQRIYFSDREFTQWSRKINPDLAEPGINEDEPDRIMTDGEFFSRIGFSEVHSCDISQYQGSTHTVDLNEPIPPELVGRYDFVFDGGTIEHVFDQRSAFRNIFDLLKPGGRVIHFSPGTQHVDHGFYMYSPTMFHEYYSANRYVIEQEQIWKFKPTAPTKVGTWSFYEYTPGSLYWHTYTFPGPMGIFVVARKTEETLRDAVPQQGAYAINWEDLATAPGDDIGESTGVDIEAQGLNFRADLTATRSGRKNVARLKDAIKSNRVLYTIALWLYRRTPWNKMPRKIGNY